MSFSKITNCLSTLNLKIIIAKFVFIYIKQKYSCYYLKKTDLQDVQEIFKRDFFSISTKMGELNRRILIF